MLVRVDGNEINRTTRARLDVRILRKLLEDRREHSAGSTPAAGPSLCIRIRFSRSIHDHDSPGENVLGIKVDKRDSVVRPRGRRHPSERLRRQN